MKNRLEGPSTVVIELVAMALWAGYTTADATDVDYSWGVRAWPAVNNKELWRANAKNLLAAIMEAT